MPEEEAALREAGSEASEDWWRSEGGRWAAWREDTSAVLEELFPREAPAGWWDVAVTISTSSASRSELVIASAEASSAAGM